MSESRALAYLVLLESLGLKARSNLIFRYGHSLDVFCNVLLIRMQEQLSVIPDEGGSSLHFADLYKVRAPPPSCKTVFSNLNIDRK